MALHCFNADASVHPSLMCVLLLMFLSTFLQMKRNIKTCRLVLQSKFSTSSQFNANCSEVQRPLLYNLVIGVYGQNWCNILLYFCNIKKFYNCRYYYFGLSQPPSTMVNLCQYSNICCCTAYHILVWVWYPVLT